MNPDYWQKQDRPLFESLIWNIPEQKQGTIYLVGGNSQNFRTVEHVASYLANQFPLKSVEIVLPDSLEKKLPPLPNIHFIPSTSSGSFANSPEFTKFSSGSALQNAELTSVILLGDFSKNSETASAITEFIKNATTPIYLTRDTIDLIASDAVAWIEQDNINLVASMVQLQKLFRSVYFPKMLLLSSPLLPIIEALHKFTLSYPCTITTFHGGQIITTSAGQVVTTPIKNTNYTPISLWDGQLAANIATFNLYNPQKALEASAGAILS